MAASLLSPRRLLGALAVAAALPLAAPAAGVAASSSSRPAPVAHVALGFVQQLGQQTSRTRSTGPRGSVRRAGVSAAPRACANAQTPAAQATEKVMRAAVICLVNQQRASHGLPALHDSGRLDRSAQGWTNTLVRTLRFTHGADFASRITAVGYDWSRAGENIAAGFSTPSSVVSAWMGSPGHCRNILSPYFADIGVGVKPTAGGDGTTWTQDFALWMGHALPSRDTAAMASCGTGD